MIFRKIFKFFFLFIILSHSNNPYKTLVSVNNTIITNMDLNSEVRILKIINQNIIIDNNNLKKNALKNLIEENIKAGEILQKKIIIENDQVKRMFNIFLTNTPGIESKLNNFDKEIIKEKIRINIGWNKLINQMYSWKININMNEINNNIDNKKNYNEKEKKKLKEDLIKKEKEKKISVFSKYHMEKLKKNSLIKYYQ